MTNRGPQDFYLKQIFTDQIIGESKCSSDSTFPQMEEEQGRWGGCLYMPWSFSLASESRTYKGRCSDGQH